MKNIHVLPTDKPSRLISNVLGLGLVNDDFTKSDLELIQAIYQNIYITSDEEIKEGDWFICQNGFEKKCVGTTIINNEVYLLDYLENTDRLIWCKKIILTTDPDLIKDGVQAIDDEFLEWFVKNPSCEWVEIEYWQDDLDSVWQPKYSIIIPKEEPCDNCNNDVCCCIIKEEPKQETLEEVVERFLSKELLDLSDWDKRHILKAMVNMSKWQQEQNKNLYSEEEVLHILTKFSKFGDVINQEKYLKQWFKQFKKQ